MGRKKLPPEEALKRKRESTRKSKQRPEAKERTKLLQQQRRALKRKYIKTSDSDDKKTKHKLKLLEAKRKYRADPIKYERELTLKRENRKRKKIESLESLKRLRLNPEPNISTSSTINDDDMGENFEPELDYNLNEIFGYNDPPIYEIDLEKLSSITCEPDNKCSDKVYKQLLEKCNGEKKVFLDYIKRKLEKRPDKRLNIMVDGAAGTGKSFLIETLDQTLIRIFEKLYPDSSYFTVLKIAPTGKAAQNIGGETIHSALGIGGSRKMSQHTVENYTKKFAELKCVIIDEISMVGAKLYEKINRHLKLFKGNDLDFGGLHVFHFGDFNQLPPVKDDPIFKQKDDSKSSSFKAWESVRYYQLKEIVRQKEDKTYAQLLDRVRTLEMIPGDEAFFKSKETTFEQVPKTATLLFRSNREVDMANKLRLDSIAGDIIDCFALDTVSGNADYKSKKEALVKLKRTRRIETGNLENNIQFKEGAKYMLTYNVDTFDGLYNGAVGYLRKIEYCSIKRSKKKAIKRVWIEFLNRNEIGRELRNQVKDYALQNAMSLNWTPIDRINRLVYHKNNKVKNEYISITRNQFPLVIAEAMTIHKAQGATFEEVAVGFTTRLTRSLQYVALSRVTTAKGLYIIGEYKKPPPLRESDPMVREMKRLKCLSIDYEILYPDREDYFDIW